MRAIYLIVLVLSVLLLFIGASAQSNNPSWLIPRVISTTMEATDEAWQSGSQAMEKWERDRNEAMEQILQELEEALTPPTDNVSPMALD